MAASSSQDSSSSHLDFPSLDPVLKGCAVPSTHLPSNKDWPFTLVNHPALPTPFPCRTTNIRLGYPQNPSVEHIHAERLFATLLDNLVSHPLSDAQVRTHFALLCAIKTCNRLHICCTAHMLHFLAHPQGRIHTMSDTMYAQPRGGYKTYAEFFVEPFNNEITIKVLGAEQNEQAYALQHDLSPEIVTTLRAGLVSTELLLSPGGVAKLRRPDATVVSFRTEDDILAALIHYGRDICVLSYRHVMHPDGKTGLCQRQLESVRERLQEYDYVWVDTVHSRASRRRWTPACVALYGIFECIQTCDALEQLNRTWLRTESLMKEARLKFKTNPDISVMGHVRMSSYRNVQLQAARAIVLGELNDTECTFEEDKTRLKEWAFDTITWPKAVSTGSMRTQSGYRESMAARDHYEMSVLKLPFYQEKGPSLLPFNSPERIVLESILAEKMNCHEEAFVLRLVMHMQLAGHCFYDEQERMLYVFYGDVGMLGQQLLIYLNVRVQNKGAWMHITYAQAVIARSLTHEEGILLSSAMIENCNDEINSEHVARRCKGCCVPEMIVSADKYWYRCRNADIMKHKEEYKILLQGARKGVVELAQRIGDGVLYRKLCTTYFACDMHQFEFHTWDYHLGR